jgi:hypothetical protein
MLSHSRLLLRVEATGDRPVKSPHALAVAYPHLDGGESDRNPALAMALGRWRRFRASGG